MTLLVCAFIIPIITISTSKFGKSDLGNRIDIITTTRNNWESLTIPDDMKINATLYHYKEMKIINQTGCIDRYNYTREFLRLFNINPYSMELDSNYILIVGSNTELGSSIKKLLKEQHKQYIELNGIIDFDPAPLMEILSKFSSKITKAIICTQPTQHRYITKGFDNYNERQTIKTIKSYCEAFVQHRIPFIIAHHPPYSSSLIDIAEFFESPIVLVPFLTEFEEFRNYEHPIFRSAMECALTGKTEIDKYENYPVSSIKLSEISNFILNHEINRRRCVERIISENSLSIEEVLTQNFKNCSINFKNNFKFDKNKMNEIKTVQLKDVSNINKFVTTNIQKILQKTHKNETFLSIVVSGRNDNYFKGKFIEIMQKFIDIIDKSLEKVPLARIEVVIVEYNNNSTKSLSEVLKTGKNLHKKIKIVKVSHQNHLELQKLNNFEEDFDSNLAKTIGIMKSSGKFVLVTNPDIILPIKFLDYTTNDNFVDGVVYLANRIDIINTYAQKLQLEDVFNLVNSPWKLDQSENAAPICISETFGTYVMRTINDFRQNIVCNSKDFILASKSMWSAIRGFPKKENNKDTNARILSNFMRILNGFTLKFMNDPVIELNIDEPKPIENMPEFSPQTKKMICKGIGEFYRFNHENFEEFVL